MRSPYSTAASLKKTHQSHPVLNKTQVLNAAGGYVFELDSFQRAEQFILLGTEGGTFYIGEQKLTIENTKNLIAAIKKDGLRVVNLIKEISDSGRAMKNEPAIFALAVAMTFGDEATKKAAYAALPEVTRIGTHIFHFAQYIQELRGWSRGLRNAVAKFMTNRKAEHLAMQMVKYRQRDGWTFKDVIRLSHPHAPSLAHADLFKWAIGKEGHKSEVPLVVAFEELQAMKFTEKKEVTRAVELLKAHGLPWEALPTEALKHTELWEAMLPNMGIQALVRNLAKMSSIGMTTTNTSQFVKDIVQKLTNSETISKSRIHPITLYLAQHNYSAGHGFRGSLTWTPNGKVVESLMDAMLLSMGNIEPINKNLLVAVDCSGSMNKTVANTNISATMASGAMAWVLAQTEKNLDACWFSTGASMVSINKRMSLNEVVRAFNGSGGTDGAAPVRLALQNKTKYDAILELTDSDTWAGEQHVFQAFQEYKKLSPGAKFITLQTTPNGVTLSDPADSAMATICGFDAAMLTIAKTFIDKK